MQKKKIGNKFDVSLGELIEAVSEIAFEYADNSREAQLLAQIALVEILKKATFPGDAKRMLTRITPDEGLIN